jgi:hypothetical protein
MRTPHPDLGSSRGVSLLGARQTSNPRAEVRLPPGPSRIEFLVPPPEPPSVER